MTTIRLRIGPLVAGAAEPHYPVQIGTDDCGGLRAVAHIPEPDARAAITATAEVLIGGAASKKELQDAGRALLALLLREDVAVAWAELTANSNGDDQARVVVDVDPDELRALPWELALPSHGPYLFVGGQPIVARGSYETAVVAAEDLVVPVMVLVVVGDPAETALRAHEEVDAIFAALGHRPGEWHVEVAMGPKQGEFFQILDDVKPHVLHFLGHSRPNLHSGDAGLEIRPENPDDTWWLDGDLVDNVVAEAPKLVFLNACRTSAEGAASRGVAAAFVEHGASAVLAMQGDIQSGSAVAFTRTVYEALAASQPIDAAVRLGRQTLMKLEQPVARDWALPTLTLRSPPERVLPICTRRPRTDVEQLFDRYLDDVRSFVDRSAKHRELWEALRQGSGSSPLVMLDGAPGAGKSTLMQCCLHTMSLQGRPVAYVDLDAGHTGPTLKWLNVLCHIRDAIGCFLPDRAAAPREAFDRALWFYRQGREPDPREPAGPTPADTIWNPQSEHEPRLREAVFTAFLGFLRAVAGADPLVMAIDHLRALDRSDVDILGAGLLEPVEKGVCELRAVLVETTDDAARMVPAKLRDRAKTVTLPLFSAEETIRVFREFGARRGRPFDGAWMGFANAMVKAPPWKPEALQDLDTLSGRL